MVISLKVYVVLLCRLVLESDVNLLRLTFTDCVLTNTNFVDVFISLKEIQTFRIIYFFVTIHSGRRAYLKFGTENNSIDHFGYQLMIHSKDSSALDCNKMQIYILVYIPLIEFRFTCTHLLLHIHLIIGTFMQCVSILK